MTPGELLAEPGDIELNAGRPTLTLAVANGGDRPIQVGSHYHFVEANPALQFDRAAARGMRLDIAAGTAVRFEPGQTRALDRGYPVPLAQTMALTDSAPSVARSVGASSGGTQPLSAHLYGAPAPQAGNRPRSSAPPADRNRYWLSLYADVKPSTARASIFLGTYIAIRKRKARMS